MNRCRGLNQNTLIYGMESSIPSKFLQLKAFQFLWRQHKATNRTIILVDRYANLKRLEMIICQLSQCHKPQFVILARLNCKFVSG